MTPRVLDATQTAHALPYGRLADQIEALLMEGKAQVPSRIVMPVSDQGVLFVMPATDGQLAITKLISFVSGNAQRGLPAIQGDIVVFDAHTGQRLAFLDGPTVTARRTAAVSLLAAKTLAPNNRGPLLIVGAGVQGRSHLEAFHTGLGVQEVGIASRSEGSAKALVAHALAMGLKARYVTDANRELGDFSLVVSSTSAQAVALTALPRAGSFVAAIGAFSPKMVEWAAPVCQALAKDGLIVVDTRDADHEAGDLLQAGIKVSDLPCLADVVKGKATHASHVSPDRPRTVFFKSCGWAGWDLAAAKAALAV